MSLTFEVSLISGKTVSLQTDEDESVESLRLRGQTALGAGKGQLLDSIGNVLDGGLRRSGCNMRSRSHCRSEVSLYVAEAGPLRRFLGMAPS